MLLHVKPLFKIMPCWQKLMFKKRRKRFFLYYDTIYFNMNTNAEKINNRKKRDIVIIFPYNTETHELLIIEEYINHYDKKFWKAVTGGIDKEGKDEITHAREELAEEIGMESKNLYHLHSNQKVFGARGIHAFIAENPTLMENPPGNPDTDVITDIRWVNEEVFWNMLDSGELLWNETALIAVQVFRNYKK